MNYEIKHGVPLPERKPGSGPKKKPFRTALESLNVGDMIEVPVEQAKTVSGTLKNVTVFSGARYARRTMDNGNIGVWRIA